MREGDGRERKRQGKQTMMKTAIEVDGARHTCVPQRKDFESC